jgi:heavy metal sensor kinase
VIFNSFRSRLAFISALLSGVALLGFATFAWWVVYDIKIKQIEMDVTANAERESHRMFPPEVWQEFGETVLPRVMGLRDPQHLLLLVEDETGQIIYRSEHWPSTLDAARFSWPAKSKRFDAMPPDLPIFRPPGQPEGWPQHPRDFIPPGAPGELPDRMRPDQLPRPDSAVQTLHAGNAEWKIGLATTPHSRVVVAVNLDAIDQDLAAIRNGFLLAVPVALLFIGVGAWLVSVRALKPVGRLGNSICNVTAQGLDHRIELGGEDREFAALITGFNDMLERLEKSFKQASRFSADAAHELKTPLTILQGQIERAMSQAEAGSPMQMTLGGFLDEVGRLSAISRKLLLLSQADAGRLRLQRVPFNLSTELGELLEDTKMMAPGLNVSADIPDAINLQADEDLLRQVLVNLISNAVKYNNHGGWIRVSASRMRDTITVVIANASSAGIPLEFRAKIFERFYRVDSAHSRKIDGSGLGLSLSREIARAHGGELSLDASSNTDVQFRLVIPCESS